MLERDLTMLYLDYTQVLPHGSPTPDLSGQPDVQDFIPADLWERRHEIAVLNQQENQAHPDVRRFNEGTKRWLHAVRAHTKQLENANNIEFCNWQAYSTPDNGPGDPPRLWIQHGFAGPNNPQPYTNAALRAMLLNDGTGMSEINGWDTSSPLQQQALMEACRLHLLLTQDTTA